MLSRLKQMSDKSRNETAVEVEQRTNIDNTTEANNNFIPLIHYISRSKYSIAKLYTPLTETNLDKFSQVAIL